MAEKLRLQEVLGRLVKASSGPAFTWLVKRQKRVATGTCSQTLLPDTETENIY